jgi:hypothetical protein
VNFNNGNANLNNRNNRCCVRAVRSVARPSECQVQTVSFRELVLAWRRARQRKAPSAGQLDFERNWTDRLLDLQDAINAGTWQPSPTTCFVATRPKAREIHAPAFGDRVVHHWAMSRLESIFDPGFIETSFANRKGKGSHAAVECVKGHVRQVTSGQGHGWYLQLDIANYFNTIHRPTLWTLLKRRMIAANVPAVVQRVVHALLRQSPTAHGVVRLASAQELALVPPHKRLENAAPGCGIAIGNLSSQFFANVYLDRLDQFVKHTLRARRYVRYVDDFVLVHESREQLERWRSEIGRFLERELRLKLKAGQRLRPLADGIDFLGYVVFPTHTRVRSRVVRHARAALKEWSAGRVRGNVVRATPNDVRHAQSVLASYEGHFQHANAWRLRQQFRQQFPWTGTVRSVKRFRLRDEGRRVTIKTTESRKLEQTRKTQ